MIPFFVPEFTKDMENAAIDALRNEKFVMGESVFKFEEEFARYIGTKFAISLNSGNAALQLSLISLGINEKSKVITSTNSFIASANCILMTGAKPILCDINHNDGNIDIKTTNEKSDAIIPVHIYGNPCDLDSIKNLSEEYNIPIIEDACQAHGAIYDQKKVGSLGSVGCFSFYPTKNMTVCGDGGMVTTNNDEIKNKRRREIATLYKKFLVEDCILSENPRGTSVYHQIVLKHKKRDEIVSHLSKNDIGTAIYYPIPIHKQPLYIKYGFNLPISEKFSQEVLSLPSYPGLDDDDVKLVCEKINEVI